MKFILLTFVAVAISSTVAIELIGGPCTGDSDCSGNSRCSLSNDCACPPRTVANFDLTQCLDIVDVLKGPCEQDHQCQLGEPGKNSHCSNQGVCECVPGAAAPLSQHKCFLKAEKVGDKCEVDDQCLVNLGHTRCVNSKCECYPTHVISADGRTCVVRKELGEPCTDSGQCRDIQTPGSAVCTSAFCRCNSGYESPPGVTDACYKMAVYTGDSCSMSAHQCSSIPNTECVENSYGDKSCRCVETHVSSSSRQSCLPKVENLNGTCTESGQCVQSNVNCIDGLCSCITDYTPSVEKPESCVRIARNFLFSCDEDVQCTTWLGEGTYCYIGRCICTNTHVFRLSCQPRRDASNFWVF